MLYASQNPKKTIAFMGFLAAIVSCYPIVFFGKTFAYVAGAGAVYSAPPWFPGLPVDAIYESFRDSDIGAAVWSSVPNTAAQYASVFHHFEFPLWNRYVAGGVPFFAQGQSFSGDILHWIPISMGGSALGWDIKVVLSKAIFATGMGLLVYRLTGRQLAGVLVAISSCFLGFFAWRFNHPALFVLTYAPWVVLQWDRVGSVLATPGPRVRTCVLQGFLLAVVAWLQLNAGVPKEGMITAVFMHALGILLFLGHVIPRRGLLWSLGFASGLVITLVLITAPYWLLFLDALGKSYTHYDIPGVNTYPPWAIIGFFDNLFFLRLFRSLTGPSTNLFVLLCMSSALFALRARQSWAVYAVWGLFALAFCTAYSVIPHSILIAIPFINKIQHVGNTFSVPMILLSLIIAGYGVRNYLAAPETQKKKIQVFSVFVLLALWLFSTRPTPPGALAPPPGTLVFAERFILVSGLFLASLLFLYLSQKSRLHKARYGLVILGICFVALHVRHGLHLFTGVGGIDLFVTNPTERPDFLAPSSAIEYLKEQIKNGGEPTRVIGEGAVFYPGSNVRLGLEGLVSVEPLRSQNYENILNLFTFPDPRGWGWLRLVNSDEIAVRANALDFLGVGYIVANPGVEMPGDMNLMHSSDLAIWQRTSVWPRAFFVNNIKEVHATADILDLLEDKSQTPFAAVETAFIPAQYQGNDAVYRMVPASNYHLTNNSTSFSINASGPGIIVLGETYYPGDFEVQVNGENVDYIRVNESSKGIWVEQAGSYNVSFRYRPEKLQLALTLMFTGLLLQILLLTRTFHQGGPRKDKYDA